MDMNWTFITIIVSVLLACAGGIGLVIKTLIKKYFEHLELRISKLEKSQEEYQNKMIDAVRSIEKALTKLETGESRFMTINNCAEQNRRIDDKISKNIDNTKADLFDELKVVELRLEKQIAEIKTRIEKHFDKED